MSKTSHGISMMQPATWVPLAGLAGLWLGTQAMAQALPPSLLACTQMRDDRERLRCFDREMQAVSRAADAKPRESAAPAARSALQAASPAVPPAAADMFGHPAPAPAAAKRLEAHIASVGPGSGSRRRFVLDNGQVWQQAEIDDTFQAKAGDPVVLSKGMLGSYFMSAGTHPAVRVSRVN